MYQNKNPRLGLSGLVVFVIFLAYFATTAHFLPNGAGPDYPLSRNAADFYLQNGRLAVYPQDEAKMGFSQFGNSRLLRPPLGYGLAALISKVRGTTIQDHARRYYSYRLANAFFGALTVAIIFATIFLAFNSWYLAVFGSLAVGLMPQFTFIASYLNDDGSAIAAVSLIVLSMVKIIRDGATLGNCILFAFAVGVNVITKKAGWVFLPSAMLFYLAYILRFDRTFLKKHIIMALTFFAAGGWWLLFNMLQYGWNDPFLSKVINTAAWQNTTLDLNRFGFIAEQGVGMVGLILNYRNFVVASYFAVVGHLDWLALRVGWVQYIYYLIIVFGLMGNAVLLLIDSVKFRFRNRQIWFEWMLYVSIGLQVLAYVWVNAHNDIQLQGKYIMPVVLPMLILALSFYVKLLKLSAWRSLFDEKAAAVPELTLATKLVLGLILISPIIVHIDAIVSHVIPFYWPDLALNAAPAS